MTRKVLISSFRFALHTPLWLVEFYNPSWIQTKKNLKINKKRRSSTYLYIQNFKVQFCLLYFLYNRKQEKQPDRKSLVKLYQTLLVRLCVFISFGYTHKYENSKFSWLHIGNLFVWFIYLIWLIYTTVRCRTNLSIIHKLIYLLSSPKYVFISNQTNNTFWNCSFQKARFIFMFIIVDFRVTCWYIYSTWVLREYRTTSF